MTSTVPASGGNLVEFTEAQSMWVYLERYKSFETAQRLEAYNAWKDLQSIGREI